MVYKYRLWFKVGLLCSYFGPLVLCSMNMPELVNYSTCTVEFFPGKDRVIFFNECLTVKGTSLTLCD